MILRQTLALFVDAYRELNAKKLFWICLALSGIVVVAFAGVTITESGISLFTFDFPNEIFNTSTIDKELFYYNMLFVSLGIQFWLTWIATVLALISTASIFPDFVSGGSIEAMLSKPIGRWRLFLTKYLTGLLFAVAQVAVFTVACFFLVGFKASLWEPKMLLAIPLVTIFFSYLFCVCTLIGLVTRSTIAAILLTILFWFLNWGVHVTEATFLNFRSQREIRIERHEQVATMLDRQVAGLERLLQDMPGDMSMSDARREIRVIVKESLAEREELAGSLSRMLDEPPTGVEVETPAELVLARLQDRREAEALVDDYLAYWNGRSQWLPKVHKGFLAFKTVLPKTSETIELLNRYLADPDSMNSLADASDDPDNDQRQPFGINQTPPEMDAPPRDVRMALRISPSEEMNALNERIQSRPEWWVIGTSLGFEAFILLISGWYFARKDF